MLLSVCVIITFESSLFFCLKGTNGAFSESDLFMNILASFEQWILYFKARETRLIQCFHGNKGHVHYYFCNICYPIPIPFQLCCRWKGCLFPVCILVLPWDRRPFYHSVRFLTDLFNLHMYNLPGFAILTDFRLLLPFTHIFISSIFI